MSERYQNGFDEEKGFVKIYLPDGHLYKGKGERIGAGEEIWKYTRFPYGTLNWQDGMYVGRHENVEGNNRSSMIRISRDEIASLGYPTDDIDYILLVIMRPEDIPESVMSRGMGISGKDLIADKLRLDIFGKSDAWFEHQLEEKGVYPIENLEYRPSRLIFAALKEYGIRTFDDIKQKEPLYGDKIIVASEFAYLTELAMKKMVGMREKKFNIRKTAGRTESLAVAKDVDLIVEIVESGQSLLQNNLDPITPLLLDRSTPYFIVNRNTNERFPNFTVELHNRLKTGKSGLKDEMGYLFEDKLDPRLAQAIDSETPQYNNPNNPGFNNPNTPGFLERLYSVVNIL